MNTCVTVIISVLTMMIFFSGLVDARSCQLSHPQTHYCNADYVVKFRVLSKWRSSYNVEITKYYKSMEKPFQLCKHVRNPIDRMFDNDLEVGKSYVVAGRGRLTLCSYVKEYWEMSVIERKGFAGAYQKACSCEISPCYGKECQAQSEYGSGCKWKPSNKCETSYGICKKGQKSGHGCHWQKNKDYKACLKNPRIK